MNSRAASAASSRRVRQDLVQLLFGRESASATSKEICRSKRLDHSIYSYAELRAAYLERLHNLHPDKEYSEKDSDSSYWKGRHSEFVELQEAWDRYDRMAKIAKNVDSDSKHKDREFTLFGVGCSFSDSEAERQLRTEITDQACRGWFSAGTIAASSATNRGVESLPPAKYMPLLDEDDDMFVNVATSSEESMAENKTKEPAAAPRRSSLVGFRPRSVSG